MAADNELFFLCAVFTGIDYIFSVYFLHSINGRSEEIWSDAVEIESGCGLKELLLCGNRSIIHS